MASLMWESAGFMTSVNNPKFRIKMSDGSNMSDSDEGVDFINIVNAQDFNSLGFGENGYFKFSLGLGYVDYNYDEMWQVAEEVYSQVPWEANRFASLGGGVGLVTGYGHRQLPLTGTATINIISMYWEVTNYSCVLELELSLLHVNGMNEWGNNITIYAHSSQTNFLQDIGLSFGEGYSQNWTVPYSQLETVQAEWIDGYNILVGFILQITSDNVTRDIFPVDRSAVENTILEGSINTNEWNGYGIFPFAPVHFSAYAYDFSVNILNLNKPDWINEGESAPISLQLQSQDYNGDIEIYLLDNESVDSVNDAIGEDLSSWYGEIGEDVVAQYGTLDYNGQKIVQDSIVVGETKLYNITYTANNVDSGQTDNMSIFIKFGTPNLISYGDDEPDATLQWNLVAISDHFSYSDNIEIPILDIYEEWVEEYNPSDTLITQPSDIMHHIISQELGLGKDNIDIFSKQKSWDQHTGFEMAFSVNKEIESKTLIQEISQSCKSIPTLVNDILKFITIKDTYNGFEETLTINADDVLRYSFSRTSVDDIKTKVEVHYERDYGLDTYLSSSISLVSVDGYFFNGDYGSLDDLDDSNYYGVKYSESDNEIDHIDSFLDFKCKYIRDDDSALMLSHHLLLWNLNQHNIVDLKLPLKYYALEIGDLIDFDKMILGKKVCGEKYVLDSDGDMPFRCGQAILPLFMVTETKKGLNDVTIKAIQLHHMSNSNPFWKGYEYSTPSLTETEIPTQYVAGSGDVNGDGFTDVLDVVITINGIIDESINTWESDRFSAADMNSDGSINVLDVVIMVNQIIN